MSDILVVVVVIPTVEGVGIYALLVSAAMLLGVLRVGIIGVGILLLFGLHVRLVLRHW